MEKISENNEIDLGFNMFFDCCFLGLYGVEINVDE